jgi:hypothetical protein
MIDVVRWPHGTLASSMILNPVALDAELVVW